MRFVRRVESLEGKMPRSAGRPVGLCWSHDESRVDPAAAAPGEHVAIDVVEDSETISGVTLWSCSERFATGRDLGTVRDIHGEELGRIVRFTGMVVDVEYGPAYRAPPSVGGAAAAPKRPRR